jgi:uncharacterized protein YjhX (UPF0386 family)
MHINGQLEEDTTMNVLQNTKKRKIIRDGAIRSYRIDDRNFVVLLSIISVCDCVIV